MKRRHWIYIGAAVLLLGGAFVLAFRPQPVPVEAEAVARGPFELTIDENGRTRVRDRYVVSAPLAGRLARITLRPGDAVAAGKPVARLYPLAPSLLDVRTQRELAERVGSAEAQRAQARAERARAEAARAQAQTDFDRQRKLQAEGFLAPAARDQAELALRVQTRALEAAIAGEDAAGHLLAQARAALARSRGGDLGGKAGTALPVIAPVSGQVLRVMQQSESVVALGAPLMEVADTGALEIVVEVLSTDAARIAPGARVHVEAGDLKLDGRVQRVEPAAFTKVSALGVEEQRVNVIVDFAGERGAPLGDGYRVDLRIVTYASADALTVPVAALFRRGEQWSAFVLDGERAVLRAIRLGARGPLLAVVEDGLREGERVIVYPSDLLRDGARVNVVRAGR